MARRDSQFPLPPNCFIIIFPKMEIETLVSEGYSNKQINTILQAYIDSRCFLPETESGDSLKTDFDTWRISLNTDEIKEILSGV